jgi:rRNA pseudouridine-1189 N-methylase Emg1 (Nep1/Mra1 family)
VQLDRATLILLIDEADAMGRQADERGLHDEALGAWTVMARITELYEQSLGTRTNATRG